MGGLTTQQLEPPEPLVDNSGQIPDVQNTSIPDLRVVTFALLLNVVNLKSNKLESRQHAHGVRVSVNQVGAFPARF